jgi:hypothetical protein
MNLLIHCEYTGELRGRGVAQLASARALGARGRKFESSHPDQRIKKGSKRMVKFILYLVRWQLSTPILAPVVAYFKHSPSVFGTKEDWIGATIANLIGGCIFFWVDRFIFKSKTIEKWEFIRAGKCFDCGQAGIVKRLAFAPGGYDRLDQKNPEFRCKVCSQKKYKALLKQQRIKI